MKSVSKIHKLRNNEKEFAKKLAKKKVFKKIKISEEEELELTSKDISELIASAKNLSYDDMIELEIFDDDTFDIIDASDTDEDEDVYDDGKYVYPIKITEILTLQGRIKKRFAAKRNRQILKIARQRASRRTATPEVIKRRAQRGARNHVYKRILRGRNRAVLPPSERERFERLIVRYQPLISRLQRIMIPQVRRAEINRLKKGRTVVRVKKGKTFKPSIPIKKKPIIKKRR